MTKAKHATLSEVAKKAGVGTTTVSRVINGGQSVDPKTLARVQRAIESLGYQPNQAARILKGDRTRTVGFVIPSIADPFFSSCAEAAQAVARSNDCLLIVLTTQNDPRAEMDAVHLLIRHRVDGFMIAPAGAQDGRLRETVRRLHMPVVALDRPLEGAELPAVVADNADGAHCATQHLIEHGYRRILCLTGEPELFTIQERMRGYREAMAGAGLPALLNTTIEDYPTAERILLRMQAEGELPEAILSLKNSTTVDVFEVLQRHGIAIPGTVALLGFDDFLLADAVRPSISVVEQPINEIGHKAAELLFQRLLHAVDGATAPAQVQVKTRLILRQSCGCGPVAAKGLADGAGMAQSTA